MASWVTHLMIADSLLAQCPTLDRTAFCVGNIAPDCNVENADFTAFTPPRALTHWMQGPRKTLRDADAFRQQQLLPRLSDGISPHERAFWLGYYVHLIADSTYQDMIRDEARVKAVWQRIRCSGLQNVSASLPETWDGVKALLPAAERQRDVQALEAAYLNAHPDSGYLTDILPLKAFPDYADFLPSGAIVRKIGVMGTRPAPCQADFIALTPEEFDGFRQRTITLAQESLQPFVKR